MSAFKTWLTGLTSKTTPVDADELYVLNSVGTASNKLTWANLKTTLASTFLSLTGGTVAGGTRTTSGSTLTITETRNNAGVAFPGALIVDVTDTASAAGSLLASLKVGGVAVSTVKRDGLNTSFAFVGHAGSGVAYGYAGLCATSLGLDLASVSPITWRSTSSTLSGSQSLSLYMDAAGTLAQRNGTNAQKHRWYGTFTDASNGRWLEAAVTTAGVASITPTGNGTGASGNVLHISGLPTSNPGPGILWNNAGTPAIGT